jgi:hypothetical protein
MLGRGTAKRPGAVDFSPERLLDPGPNGGFPAAASRAGAVADPRYSPFVRIAGTNVVFNAPIVATGERRFDIRRHSNTHDRLFDIDVRNRTVDMNFIRAFARPRHPARERSPAASGLCSCSPPRSMKRRSERGCVCPKRSAEGRS